MLTYPTCVQPKCNEVWQSAGPSVNLEIHLCMSFHFVSIQSNAFQFMFQNMFEIICQFICQFISQFMFEIICQFILQIMFLFISKSFQFMSFHSFIRLFVRSFIHAFIPFLSFHFIALHCIPFHSFILSFSLSLSLSLSVSVKVLFCEWLALLEIWGCLRSEVRFGKYCRSSTGLLDTFGVRIWKCLEPVLGISLGKAPRSTLSCVRWRVEAAACHKTCLAESNFVVPARRIWETQHHMNTLLHDITCIMPRYDVHMSPYVSLLAVLNVRKVNKCANHTHVKFGLTWQ